MHTILLCTSIGAQEILQKSNIKDYIKLLIHILIVHHCLSPAESQASEHYTQSAQLKAMEHIDNFIIRIMANLHVLLQGKLPTWLD